ncbi:hypothetical protein B0J11DRAFT_156442 [Dendryphion nanum]|uniref:Uncharacterized protein n=1 Tax=Dendryphion nanum TaxID=256645 RepID=A0A9P9EBE2_9PLEO|nr:hypothetical protein B0J11DRAFT_156442 [Dendryphion nanum]
MLPRCARKAWRPTTRPGNVQPRMGRLCCEGRRRIPIESEAGHAVVKVNSTERSATPRNSITRRLCLDDRKSLHTGIEPSSHARPLVSLLCVLFRRVNLAWTTCVGTQSTTRCPPELPTVRSRLGASLCCLASPLWALNQSPNRPADSTTGTFSISLAAQLPPSATPLALAHLYSDPFVQKLASYLGQALHLTPSPPIHRPLQSTILPAT